MSEPRGRSSGKWLWLAIVVFTILPLLLLSALVLALPTLLMGGVYATVLAKLRKDPLVVIRRRLSLTPLQKVMVVGARMLRPHFV